MEGTFQLGNSSDLVRLTCGGATIDEVAYDNGATFPDPNGASMNLDPASYDAVANDTGANWCEALTDLGGDHGTPGGANDVCRGPATYPIDVCSTHAPTVIDQIQGTQAVVHGRVGSAGLTDVSGRNDLAVELTAWAGVGPDGSDPSTDPGWVWIPAVGDASYNASSPGHDPSQDDYLATVDVPSPAGAYDFAFRFSGDAGATFTYCDTGAGSADGYAAVDAGQMTSQDGPPPPNAWFSEYIEGSSSNKALEIYNGDGANSADLTGCWINYYMAGSTTPGNTIRLAGSIPPAGVVTVCDADIDPALFNPANCDFLDSGSWFSGDDAIELYCRGTTVDVFGQIGFDPGSAWASGAIETRNQTLRRACSVTGPDPDGSNMFDPAAEWVSEAQDTFVDLGSYACP